MAATNYRYTSDSTDIRSLDATGIVFVSSDLFLKLLSSSSSSSSSDKPSMKDSTSYVKPLLFS